MAAANPGAAGPTGSGPATAWISAEGRDHPLVGKVWDVARRAFVPPERVLARLRSAGPSLGLLLGEKHDNADHHRLQAELVRALARGQSGSAAVLFEMFDVSQQPAIDRYLGSPGATADGLGPALAWEKTGWPSWSLYAPIAQVAMSGRLALVGANLPRDEVRAVAHRGLTSLGAEKVSELQLDRPFPPELEASLLAELQAAHCGHLPAAALPPMAAAQHARDAQMAAVLVRAGAHGSRTALIAGAGHVRKDRGVPFFVRQLDPNITLVSVAFVEVGSDETSPDGYAARFGSASLPFDLVWFTPRANHDDPCAAFRK